jgi:hypothetical protein
VLLPGRPRRTECTGRTVQIFASASKYAQACAAKIVTQAAASRASTNEGSGWTFGG